MAWYRVHRPKRLSDLHLNKVRERLVAMQDKGFFPQVLLFAGPRGAGKTSAARAISAILNEPKNSQTVQKVYRLSPVPTQVAKQKLLDPNMKDELIQRIFSGNSYCVIELDAASNRGIDDIRELQQKIHIPPLEGSMSVVILDEVHMLTKEAFNALLKLLEEPPNHAIFIMATTERHKIPETVISRSTEVTFLKASQAEVLEAMKRVLEIERIRYDDQALIEIAQLVDGSFRDAIKRIEEIAHHNGKITLEAVTENSGLSDDYLLQLINAVTAKDKQEVMKWFDSLRKKGVEETVLLSALIQFLYECLDKEVTPSPKVAMFLLKHILALPSNQVSPIAHLTLEVMLLDLVEKAQRK